MSVNCHALPHTGMYTQMISLLLHSSSASSRTRITRYNYNLTWHTCNTTSQWLPEPLAQNYKALALKGVHLIICPLFPAMSLTWLSESVS